MHGNGPCGIPHERQKNRHTPNQRSDGMACLSEATQPGMIRLCHFSRLSKTVKGMVGGWGWLEAYVAAVVVVQWHTWCVV